MIDVRRSGATLAPLIAVLVSRERERSKQQCELGLRGQA
jgi:hypothetical protein